LASALHLDAVESAAFAAAACGDDLSGAGRAAARSRLRGLPAGLSTLIGRERDVSTLAALLRRPSRRLLTLVGPGGVGKTCLGIRVAEDMSPDFMDGVVFASLSAIQDASLVASTIAGQLGLDEGGQRPVRDMLIDYLREKHLLLVLDNYEQILSAAPLVADLLGACPDMKVVVTSREPLHLHGEHQFPVQPLDLPPSGYSAEQSRIEDYASVQLFIERAQEVRPDFGLTDDNAHAVAMICARLDGLPLAIELAAKRVKLLPPSNILVRLNESLPFLTGGAVDAPSRLQTMRGAIGWSYDLLDDFQKSLFRRLTIFVGGCTVEAAEMVCAEANGRSIDVLEGLAALVDKSLVRQVEQHDGMGGLVLLETIREYGRTLLAVSEENMAVADRHAHYYVKLAEEARHQIAGGKQQIWLDRLECEHGNLRAALRWFEDNGSPGRAVQLAGALYKFWMLRGHVPEGRDNLERLLALTASMDVDAFRVRALKGAGALAGVAGAHKQARWYLEQALAGYQTLGDTFGIASVLNNLGALAYNQDAYGHARKFFDQSIALARSLNMPLLLATALGNLGQVSCSQGAYACARQELEEALAISRSLDDAHGVGIHLGNLGLVSIGLGEHERAVDELGQSLAIAEAYSYKRLAIEPLSNLGRLAALNDNMDVALTRCEEAVTIARIIGDAKLVSIALQAFASVLHKQGQLERAYCVYYDALTLNESIGSPKGSASCVEGLGNVAVESDVPRAVRLWGAGESLRASLEAPRTPNDEAGYNVCLAMARQKIDGVRFTSLWEEGAAMTAGEVVEYAREHDNNLSLNRSQHRYGLRRGSNVLERVAHVEGSDCQTAASVR